MNVMITGPRNERQWIEWCTPVMNVNLWGESPLYVNPANVKTLSKVIDEGKSGTRAKPG